jgi:hypothetical protein
MNKSWRMRWAGLVVCMGEKWKACRVLVGKPKGKIRLGRPRHKWEDDIKMDLREIGCSGMDWINQDQGSDQ